MPARTDNVVTVQRSSSSRAGAVFLLGFIIAAAVGAWWWLERSGGRAPADNQAQRPDTARYETDPNREDQEREPRVRSEPVPRERQQRKTGPFRELKKDTGNTGEDMWEAFRKERFPSFVGRLQRLMGKDTAVDVDWRSLGQRPDSDESLAYDLAMLVRALEPGHSLEAPRYHVDPAALRKGIERIHLRRVRRMEDRRLEVVDGTLRIDFCWNGAGRFAPKEIQTLLLDRDREQVSRWITAPETPPPPLMAEVRRNRLPVLFKDLEKAMGYPIPVHIDWPGLYGAPDASFRFVYMLSELIKALQEQVGVDPGPRVGSARARRLAGELAQERREIVTRSVKALRIRGGSYSDGPVIRFEDGALALLIIQDDEISLRLDPGKSKEKVITDIRKCPSCRKRGMEALIKDELDLEVAPLLRQAKEVHFPIAQSYLVDFLRNLIAKTPLRVRERRELREILTAKGVSLAIDWDSLIAPERTKDRVAALRMLETGEYNYNANYGELFKALFSTLR